MQIRKKDLVDESILLLLYLQLVILEFFGLGRTLNKVLAVLIILRVIVLRGKQDVKILLIAGALCIIYIWNILTGESINVEYAINNFLMLLYPAIYTYYIVFLCKNNPCIIDKCMSKGIGLFNITMIVNIVVLFVQIFVPYSINAVRAGVNEITFYKDTISGLFCYASTPVVCLFTIFVILYDITYVREVKSKLLKKGMISGIVLLIVVSCIIAVNNDNKALFLLLPLGILAYIYAGNNKVKMKSIYICLAAPLLIVILYTCVPVVKSFIDSNILKTINIITSSTNLGNTANGSNERIAIIFYALSKLRIWICGTGFGSSNMYQAGYHGFRHFGQADLGTLLLLGGVWFTIMILSYYIYGFRNIVDTKYREKKRVIIPIVGVVLCGAIYTQCFTRTNTIMCLILIILVFRHKMQSDKINVSEESIFGK